jgi:hypothetical protein
MWAAADPQHSRAVLHPQKVRVLCDLSCTCTMTFNNLYNPIIRNVLPKLCFHDLQLLICGHLQVKHSVHDTAGSITRAALYIQYTYALAAFISHNGSSVHGHVFSWLSNHIQCEYVICRLQQYTINVGVIQHWCQLLCSYNVSDRWMNEYGVWWHDTDWGKL